MVDWTPVYTRAWGGTPGLTGLIDAIGTNDGVDAYVNPHTSGKVTASMSSVAVESTPAENAFNHLNNSELAGAHTANVANSWWQVDFKDHGVVLTRVGIWNRVSGGYYPRTFKIQGSEDGISWTDLLTVSNPSSAAGTWWTGEITSTDPWSHVRVLQTGTDTGNANYLVLGEVEFWGELLEPSGPPDPQKTPVYTRTWGGTPGLTGLIDAIGTNGGVDAYVNPSPSIVTTSQSTNQDGTRTADKAFNHANTTGTSEAHTGNDANSWWQVDFKEHGVALTRVGLWNRPDSGYHPRTFKIQGSLDGSVWTDLLTVSNPSSADGTWWTGEITSTTLWSHVRVLQTGTNTAGSNHLVLGEVEFWGEYAEYTAPTDPQKTLIGHEAARVLRQGTDVPVRVGLSAIRVLRTQGGEPVRVGLSAIRVLRTQGGEPVRLGQAAIRVLRMRQKSPFSIFTETGRTPIAMRNPST